MAMFLPQCKASSRWRQERKSILQLYDRPGTRSNFWFSDTVLVHTYLQNGKISILHWWYFAHCKMLPFIATTTVRIPKRFQSLLWFYACLQNTTTLIHLTIRSRPSYPSPRSSSSSLRSISLEGSNTYGRPVSTNQPTTICTSLYSPHILYGRSSRCLSKHGE